MNNIEFLRYEPVLNEKHVGIATIRVDRRFIFRFKILPKQDGSGYSALAASYKTTRYGKDEYVSSFQFDSSYEADEIKNFVIHHCMQEIAKSQPSVFAAPQPAYNPPQQQNYMVFGLPKIIEKHMAFMRLMAFYSITNRRCAERRL